MQPKIVSFEAKKIAGYLHKCTHENNTVPAFWQEVFADGRHSKLHEQSFVKDHADYGICFGEGNELCYLLGLEVAEGAEVPAEFVQRELNGGEYAAWPAEGMEFAKAWGSLHEWIAKSDEYAGAPTEDAFELYKCECTDGVECEACKSGNMCDVYIRIVKK